jgi:hypothetical protein
MLLVFVTAGERVGAPVIVVLDDGSNEARTGGPISEKQTEIGEDEVEELK